MTSTTVAPADGSSGLRLARPQWQQLRDAHRERAQALLGDVQGRRQRGERHPVEDFLFDYYNLRPGELLAWHPGAGVLLDDPEGEYRDRKFYRWRDAVAQVDVAGFLAKRRTTLDWTLRLLSSIESRPAHLGCFGMHEWAMVYRLQPGETRHPYLPLRFEPEQIARVVEEVGVRCSHFDAFRFFTDQAVPLNQVPGAAGAPSRERQCELDQGGCLHVGMDTYKWAGKLLPVVDSGLLLDCFVLARDIRELDMKASAYDLREWGYEPVAVETPAGRAEYVRQQKGFAERGAVLRRRLLTQLADVTP